MPYTKEHNNENKTRSREYQMATYYFFIYIAVKHGIYVMLFNHYRKCPKLQFYLCRIFKLICNDETIKAIGKEIEKDPLGTEGIYDHHRLRIFFMHKMKNVVEALGGTLRLRKIGKDGDESKSFHVYSFRIDDVVYGENEIMAIGKQMFERIRKEERSVIICNDLLAENEVFN